MYLFNRSQVGARGKAPLAAAYAVGVAHKVQDITGLELSVFSTAFGAPIGTISWTTMVESLADFHTATEKLAADPGYVDMTTKAADLFEAAEHDIFAQVISSTVDAEPQAWYLVTEATLDVGHAQAAIEFGVAMQEYLASTYGLPTGFLTDSFNQMGGVAWTMGFNTPAKYDEVSTAILQDATYNSMVAEGSGNFIPGSATRSLLQRIV